MSKGKWKKKVRYTTENLESVKRVYRLIADKLVASCKSCYLWDSCKAGDECINKEHLFWLGWERKAFDKGIVIRRYLKIILKGITCPLKKKHPNCIKCSTELCRHKPKRRALFKFFEVDELL